MRHWFALWFFCLAPQVHAQNCGPVRFLNISEQTMGGRNPTVNGSMLFRQADGSFTAITGQGMPPNMTITGTTPNAQQNFFNCTAAAGRTAQPVAGRPNITDNLPGSAPRNPLWTQLLGDGSYTALGVDILSTQQNALQSLIVNSNFSYRSMATHATGSTRPQSMQVADFNGDGNRDVAVLNSPTQGNGVVSIFMGTGTAALQAAVNYTVGGFANTFTVSDFNGDNRPDIAVAGTTPTVFSPFIAVLMNNGNGTFAPAVSYPVPGASAVLAADVTGDGRTDLIVLAAGVFVLGGNADGTFRAALTSPMNDVNLITPAAGDFNKDGRLDIAAVDGNSETLVVAFGTGNGLFGNRRSYLMGSPFGSSETHLFAIDFDGDTNLDIVFGDGHPDGILPSVYNDRVKVLFNRGDGSFLGAPYYKVSNSAEQPPRGDFNGDGKLDVVVTANTGFGLMLGTGAGLQNPIIVPVVNQGFTTASRSVAAGDFNGDGKLDVVAASADSLFIILGNGNASFQTATKIGSMGEAPSLAVGDLNGDGKLDVVAGQRASGTPINNVLVFLGNGNGTFQNGVPLNMGSNPGRVQLADLNGDTRLDIIATCNGTFASTTDIGGVAVALGNGNGTFQASTLLPAGFNPTFTAVSDATGDGRPELFTSTSENAIGTYRVFIHLNQGNGTFQAPVPMNTDFGPAGIVVADFSGDGKVDLIVGHCCGETDTGLYLGNGNGTFQAETFLGIGEASGLTATDLNADGKLDLIATNTGGIALLFNLAGTIPVAECSFALSQSNGMASSIGDALGVAVKPSGASCTWTANSPDAWITVSGDQRQGPGTALLKVAPNTTAASRTGTAIVAGIPYTVTQPANGCLFTIAPQTISRDASSTFSLEMNITTGAACQWIPLIANTWLSTGTTGPGSKQVFFFLSGNTGSSPRANSVNVGGAVAQVIQSGTNPPQVFTDVPVSDGFYNFIALLRERAITAGCSATAYCPNDNTTRGQMAVFIVRALLGTEDFNFSQTPFFTDVPANHPFFKYVQKLREMGITAGCSATAYCVNDPVTRGQMAVFIIRAGAGLVSGDQFAFPATPFFTDVPANHPFFAFVQMMRVRGITAGCGANTYCPDAAITRGQMAVFIVRGLP